MYAQFINAQLKKKLEKIPPEHTEVKLVFTVAIESVLYLNISIICMAMRGTRMKCIHFWTTFRVFGLKCCYSDTMSLKYIWRLYRNQYIIFVLVGPPCATCDENIECLVDYVCDVSEACFIGTYNSSFTVRCMKVTLHPYIENIKERRKFKRLWLPPPFF